MHPLLKPEPLEITWLPRYGQGVWLTAFVVLDALRIKIVGARHDC